jgi:hypothetical protein
MNEYPMTNDRLVSNALLRKPRGNPMNVIRERLATSWLLRGELDYHLVRASMVIIFLFFGYQKWFAYEAERLIPYISNGPLIFWLYPVLLALSGLRRPGRQLVPRRLRMDIRHAAPPGLLGQAAWRPRRSRLDRDLHRHGHDHSVHAEWLGSVGRRLSGDDR